LVASTAADSEVHARAASALTVLYDPVSLRTTAAVRTLRVMMPRKHLLVVEDDADAREVMVEALEDQGYSVASVQDGAEALLYLCVGEAPPDLILLDLMMPDMDGEQFRAEQLKLREYAQIPVAVLSAHNKGEELAKQMGAVGFVRKPLSIDVLVGLVERVLG
jgi:CheY-like chemotaxis protein